MAKCGTTVIRLPFSQMYPPARYISWPHVVLLWAGWPLVRHNPPTWDFRPGLHLVQMSDQVNIMSDVPPTCKWKSCLDMERWLTPMDDFYTTRPFTQEGNYLVNSCVVNAYTLYVKSPTMRTRKDTPILTDFCPQVAQTFFTEVYISCSCACWTRCRYKGIKPWKCVDGTFKSKRCKWIWCKKLPRKNTTCGCKPCIWHLCKDCCHFTYHPQQQSIFLYFYFWLPNVS